MINKILDLIHLLFILLPIGIYFIPKKYFWLTKIIILLLLLTPLHWEFFDNYCVLTKISMRYGGFSDVNTDSPFTEKYLLWFLKPIFHLFNVEINNSTLNKAVYLQWIINYIIIYYYIFYYLKCTIK